MFLNNFKSAKKRILDDQRSIVIIGGGISGLALAAYIKDAGFNSIILEKTGRVGGSLQTINKEGYTFEYGADSTLKNLAFDQLVGMVSLKDELTQPSDKFSKKYILKKGKLHALKSSPSAMLTSGLLSSKGKKGILAERFKVTSNTLDDESVGNFFERRYGKAVVDSVVNPVVAGVYAGDPYKLGMKSILPKLAELEVRYGSISKGLKKEHDVIPEYEYQSFKNGMSTLVNRLADYVGKEDILLNTEAKAVRPNGKKYALLLMQDGIELQIEADVVVFATPAYITAELVKSINVDMAALLEKVNYPRMMVLHLGFDSKAVKRKHNGFGFMVPRSENKHFLSARYNSSLFNNRSPEGKAVFTLFVGGVQQDHLLNDDVDSLIHTVIAEFKEIMKISADPELVDYKIWEHSIPQFDVGHQDIIDGLEFFEQNTLNLHFVGNYRNGLSIADCIKGAKQTHGKLVKDYSFQSYYAAKNLA